MRYANCLQCDVRFEYEQRQGFPICPACRYKLLDDMRDARKTKRDFPYDWSFDDKIDKANEMGMSYGKFVALVHCGTLNIKELTKPIDIKSGRRKVVRHVKKY